MATATKPKKNTPVPAGPDDDSGQRQIQEHFDHDHGQGCSGVKVDPAPNSTYTVAGVTATKDEVEQ